MLRREIWTKNNRPLSHNESDLSSRIKSGGKIECPAVRPGFIAGVNRVQSNGKNRLERFAAENTLTYLYISNDNFNYYCKDNADAMVFV